ncbi:MAG: PEGA domain-containing protein [Ignavibacteriales bacterium]|nr:PEGA domain-containing protein [Ignavibacteriales bacterium]
MNKDTKFNLCQLNFDTTKEITVSISDDKNFTLTPSPRLGSVSVFVEPTDASNAEIYVDNIAKGNAPLVLPLLIGNYNITAKKNNFLDKTETITLAENEKKQLNFELLTYEGTRQQSIDRWANVKWYSIIGTALSVGASYYFSTAADKNFDNYQQSKTQTDATNFQKKTDQHNLYMQISVGAAGGFLVGTIYSWVMEKSY